MNYTLLFYVIALIYILMAIHTLSKDNKDIRNKLYFVVSMLFAFWGLLNGTLFLITEPEIAANARKYLVFSWGVVYSVILHLVLVLSGYNKKLDKYILRIFLYLPALVNVLLYFFKPIAGKDLVLTDKGWLIANYFEGGFLWNNYFYLYYVVSTLLTLIVLIIWNKQTSKKREKLQSKIMYLSILGAFVLGSIFEIILPLNGYLLFYGVTILIALIPISAMWYSIERYGLMNFNPNNISMDMLKSMSEGLVMCDMSGNVRTINNGVREILGYQEQEIENIHHMFKESTDLESLKQPTETDICHIDGHMVPVIISALPLKDSVMEQYGYLIIFQDVSSLSNMQKELLTMNEALEGTVLDRTNELLSLNEDLVNEIKEKQYAEKKIKHLAYYDQLTNLPNLRLFLDKMEKRIKDSEKEYKKFAVLFLDLDGFKIINDTKGHTEGDELLKVVARRLEGNLLKGDLVARTGGDEFYYIVSLNRSSNYIQSVMDSIIELFEQPFTINNVKTYITCSIGAAIYPEHGITTDELVKHSDIAMYDAKDNGKNRGEVFNNTMLKKIIDEEKIKDDLRLAITNNEFELYYQPLVDSNSNKVISSEALIRWNHPELGIVSPFRFINIAESNGFIDAIGLWVIETAMAQHRKWIDELGIKLPIAINLSVNQLQKKDIVVDILRLKNRFDIDLSYLTFEVTESIFIESESYAITTLKRISEIGAKIAIDDFGIAYSSLAYIKKLPIDKLKIDKVFVDGIGRDKVDEAIIKTIVTLCDDLSMEIIAEGVEALEQLEFLREVNCHRIQGYYYSKPLKVEDFEQYYNRVNNS